MDLEVLKKKISTFRGEGGRVRTLELSEIMRRKMRGDWIRLR